MSSRAQAGRGSKPLTPWTPGLTPSPLLDVIHTVGPIAHGEPSASQAAELRSCYMSSLNLLLEHRLRSAVRGRGSRRWVGAAWTLGPREEPRATPHPGDRREVGGE